MANDHGASAPARDYSGVGREQLVRELVQRDARDRVVQKLLEEYESVRRFLSRRFFVPSEWDRVDRLREYLQLLDQTKRELKLVLLDRYPSRRRFRNPTKVEKSKLRERIERQDDQLVQLENARFDRNSSFRRSAYEDGLLAAAEVCDAAEHDFSCRSEHVETNVAEALARRIRALLTEPEPCVPDEKLGRRCVTHGMLPLYPSGRCEEGRR
jgi:hypothetical protein